MPSRTSRKSPRPSGLGTGIPSKGSGDATLGRRLRALREKHGVTRQELADLLGWSLSRLGQYEMDATEPGVSELAALAAVFSVDPGILAYGPPPAAAALGITWLPNVDGGSEPFPASFLDGLPLGPYQCAVMDGPALGVSAGDILLIRAGAQPQVGSVWLVRLAEGRAVPALLHTIGHRSAGVLIGIAESAVKVPSKALLGAVVAGLKRAPPQ